MYGRLQMHETVPKKKTQEKFLASAKGQVKDATFDRSPVSCVGVLFGGDTKQLADSVII